MNGGSKATSRRFFLKSLSASGLCLSARSLSASSPWGTSDQPVTARQLAADPFRPEFHLLPARNWMNDPNGPLFWNGSYHMFYQYNPGAAVWGNMHWGHAVSPDMIHWRHLPVALGPTPGGPDQDGCFSGSAVIVKGVPTVLYTGVQAVGPAEATLRDGKHFFRETQCLATSRDPQLLVWEKLPGPVLVAPPDPKLTGFRDPFLSETLTGNAGEEWYMGIGSGIRGEGGRVLLYHSTDLREWKACPHPLARGQNTGKRTADSVDSGEMWECPDFFPLGHKFLLLYSTERRVFWQSGELDPKELIFHPEKHGMLDFGDFYAPKTQVAPDGRRILWGWITESRPEPEFSAAGWAGCMSLPRVLDVNPDGSLDIEFAREVESLRGPRLSPAGNAAAHRHEAALPGTAAELAIQFREAPWQLAIHAAGEPWFEASYDPQRSELRIGGRSVALPGRASGDHDLRMLLDASVVESIADRSIACTSRVYRTPRAPLRLSLVDSAGGVARLAVWPLHPISTDRLTS